MCFTCIGVSRERFLRNQFYDSTAVDMEALEICQFKSSTITFFGNLNNVFANK